MRYRLKWICALLVAGCSPAQKPADTTRVASAASDTVSDSAPSASRRVTILFIGTSLTAGYGLEPEEAFPVLIGRTLDSLGVPNEVRNAGVSGETSAGALRRIDWPISATDIDIVWLETGANDGLRGLDLDSTRANIDAIITRIREKHPAVRVVLAQMEAPPNMGVKYTSGFHAMFPALAKKHGIRLAPFLLEGVAGDIDLNQGDGIHPNLQGEIIVAKNVYRALAPEIAAVRKAKGL
ncbi:MAG TPA: arylesterase [Gemmatimonadaceae bacterium]|nr:arylesterase [Gemmatimonadaceae bacterium]